MDGTLHTQQDERTTTTRQHSSADKARQRSLRCAPPRCTHILTTLMGGKLTTCSLIFMRAGSDDSKT